MKGYKQAIRDRTPEAWVHVLKYLKKLDAWIELVYSTRIRPINNHWNAKERNELKKKELRTMFNGKNTFFDLLDEDRMDSEEFAKWKKVNAWIEWFTTNYLYIKQYLQDFPNLSREELIAKIAQSWCGGNKCLSAMVIDYYLKDIKDDEQKID